jgi:ribosome biogenesis GTPase
VNNALVIADYGKFCLIQTKDLAQINCTKRSSVPALVVGDRVHYQDSVITQLLTRDNLLTNANKNIAANISLMFITLAIRPHPDLLSIDSYLLKAHNLRIKPIIIVNKVDLVDDKNLLNLLQIYQNLGYEVLQVSAEKKLNINQIQAKIKGNTSIFVGNSGVGKSSLINLLTGAEQKVNHLGSDGLGKHTTTTSVLFNIAIDKENGKIIDTPGVREFNPQDFSEGEIQQGFIEFKEFVPKCKFSNCKHINEPQCEVKKQVELGKISKYRYQNYLILMESL